MTIGISKLVRKVSRRRLPIQSDTSHGSGSRRQPSRRKNVDVHKKVTVLTEKRQWDRLRDVLTSLSQEQTDELSRTNDCNQSLLHTLCSRSPPLDIVETLVASSPESLLEADYLERTALHAAVLEGASLDVVRFLLRSDPSLAERQDAEGKTPLILACEEYGMAAGPTDEPDARSGRLTHIIETLTKEGGPNSVMLEDVYGNAALEHALISRVPSGLIRMLRESTATMHQRMDAALALKRQHELMFEMKLSDLVRGEAMMTGVRCRYYGRTVAATGA